MPVSPVAVAPPKEEQATQPSTPVKQMPPVTEPDLPVTEPEEPCHYLLTITKHRALFGKPGEYSTMKSFTFAANKTKIETPITLSLETASEVNTLL